MSFKTLQMQQMLSLVKKTLHRHRTGFEQTARAISAYAQYAISTTSNLSIK
jgi:hypothetical protein